MYLMRGESHGDNLSKFVNEAFNLHYKGNTQEDIENFINNVIDGTDPMKDQREEYYQAQLLSPYGKTASENIINSILGIEEYK